MTTWSEPQRTVSAEQAGLRFGDKGMHTTRTMMLAELTDLLSALPPEAGRAAYRAAIIDENVLGKQTVATRELTNQRLGELYGLDPRLPIFRILRRVWTADPAGRPLSALLVALARDPLLRATAATVFELSLDAELGRRDLLNAIRSAVGTRINDATLDKVARNAASSWSQAGHLEGRVRKIRRRVEPTPGPLSLALWLGAVEGLAGEQLLSSRWVAVLDRSATELVPLTLQAKQLGLIGASIGGGIIEIDAARLDPRRVERGSGTSSVGMER